MKLTGKCKEEFEKWLLYCGVYGEYEYHLDEDLVSHFENLKTSMKYGVYVDFFDSVGIYVQIETRLFDNEHPVYIYHKRNYTRVGRYKKRPEARTTAIEKANEIYNKI